MLDMEHLMSTLDLTLDSNRKRHIAGGILLSISLLFGGLAMTVMTISDKKEIKKEETKKNER